MSKQPTKVHRKKRQTALVASEPYVPTEAERSALSGVIEQMQSALPHASAKVNASSTQTHLSWDHPNQPVAIALWAKALGTTDFTFAQTVFSQIAQVARTGPTLTDADLNAMLSIVRSLEPTDPTEALLVTQMAAIHNATMVAARRLGRAEDLPQQDSASTMLNKLTRTFAAQVETLKRYRLKGEQTITVQHVTVNDGGQAIVGKVQHVPGVPLNSASQSHELAAPDALGPALLGDLQAHRQPLPSAGGEAQARVPLPRRPRRSPQGDRKRRLSARQLHG